MEQSDDIRCRPHVLTPAELRIGNIVYLTKAFDETIHPKMSVEIKNFTVLEEFRKGLRTYEAIPIHKEQLIAFKFAEESEYSFTYNIHTVWEDSYHNEWYFVFKSGSITRRIYIKIKFIHQLQNLYFALTGEELTT